MLGRRRGSAWKVAGSRRRASPPITPERLFLRVAVSLQVRAASQQDRRPREAHASTRSSAAVVQHQRAPLKIPDLIRERPRQRPARSFPHPQTRSRGLAPRPRDRRAGPTSSIRTPSPKRPDRSAATAEGQPRPAASAKAGERQQAVGREQPPSLGHLLCATHELESSRGRLSSAAECLGEARPPRTAVVGRAHGIGPRAIVNRTRRGDPCHKPSEGAPCRRRM